MNPPNIQYEFRDMSSDELDQQRTCGLNDLRTESDWKKTLDDLWERFWIRLLRLLGAQNLGCEMRNVIASSLICIGVIAPICFNCYAKYYILCLGGYKYSIECWLAAASIPLGVGLCI